VPRRSLHLRRRRARRADRCGKVGEGAEVVTIFIMPSEVHQPDLHRKS
jgi:hypothetical protein